MIAESKHSLIKNIAARVARVAQLIKLIYAVGETQIPNDQKSGQRGRMLLGCAWRMECDYILPAGGAVMTNTYMPTHAASPRTEPANRIILCISLLIEVVRDIDHSITQHNSVTIIRISFIYNFHRDLSNVNWASTAKT